MITCKECDYWERSLNPRAKYGCCSCEKITNSTSVSVFHDLRDYLIFSGSHYRSYAAGQDFGCIHGKEKK